jgi:hypothetical protein
MDALFHSAPACQEKTTAVNTRLEAENGPSILIGGLITPRIVPTRPLGADAQVSERVQQTEANCRIS